MGNKNKTMTRAAGGRGKHGSWRHEHTGSRLERLCVHCACLVDVVHFFVWCRENSRITVALCVCADAQLWGSERWSSNVLGRRMRFERMTWTRKWMSCLWSFTVFSRRLRWQIPSFLGNHMACLRCCAMYVVLARCRLKLLSTLRVMLWELADEHSIAHLYRFHGISSSLRLLTVFLLLMWVCRTCVCQVLEVLPSQWNKA